MPDTLQQAQALHQQMPVVDAHHDILMDVLARHKRGERGLLSGEWGVRLRRGGVAVQVLPVFIEDRYLPSLGLREVFRMVEAAHADIAADDRVMQLATTGTDIQSLRDANKIAGVLALEGCDSLQNDPAMLRVLYRLGVRMVGLTWENRNAFADGTGVTNPGGLTKNGAAAVREMAAHHVILDVSHLAEPGFWDALKLTDAPIVASHSNARAVLDHPRNLTDDQIRAIADTGGVIGLNFVGFFISNNQPPTLDDMLNHLEHIADVAGIAHVGIGADFLEAGLREMGKQAVSEQGIDPALLDNWIPECQSAADMPNFTAKLLERGYNETDIRAVLGGNFIRVFEQVWV